MPTIVPYTYEHKRERAVDFYGLIEPMKILVATEKPFAKAAVGAIAKVVGESSINETAYFLPFAAAMRKFCKCKMPY